tara:strand:+ start:58 stop:1539 length:1482 start_codon:yes stop_codon:yes gene_type:complete
MKSLKIALLALLPATLLAAPPYALFSPHQGEEAFEKMYDYVKGAKKTAHVTIYSWSDGGITDAMEDVLTKNPGVKLRVVLHRPLGGKSSILSKVAKLEAMGAMFKRAKMNMHEKFVLVDSKNLSNSSANMSGGAKNRYSEDFTFIESEGEEDNEAVIKQFEREFAIIWNSSDDIVTKDEIQKADVLPLDIEQDNLPATKAAMTLISSSMNSTISKNSPTSADYKKGRIIDLNDRYLSNGEQPYVVSTELIEAIDNAKKSVWLALNHFNLYSVSEALIRAVKRGVEVRLSVDNQEFKTKIRDSGSRPSIEMTPRFIRDFKALPGNDKKEAPVRVHFYSHAPHHSSWHLNHHKFVLIDNELPNDAILLAGSFNLSKNAEFNQFDNLVAYKGAAYAGVISDYAKQHENLWTLNRTANDKPSKAALDYFKTVYDDSYVRLHVADPENVVALTWDEALTLKRDMNRVAPGMFRQLYSKKGCMFYNFVKQSYFGGGGCK